MVLVILVANFFAGAFLCNAVPHFVSGVTGRAFPTPFAKPPGVGLSSPVVNLVWGFANLVVGALLLSYWPVGWRIGPSLGLFLLGVLVRGVFLATHFGRVLRAGERP
jgi:hypothetical protein